METFPVSGRSFSWNFHISTHPTIHYIIVFLRQCDKSVIPQQFVILAVLGGRGYTKNGTISD
jgi:hypothetical protein